MMRMQSMHQFVHPYYTDGRGWPPLRHVCFCGARRIPRRFCTRNNYSQSFESAPKNVTRRLRGGYATRKNRPETNWLRIGTALAPEHSKRLGVTNQTQSAANTRRCTWHHHTMCT
jgi:hypothetical protein